MDRKLHIGIIGCGGIANGKHMPSLKKIDTVEMVAFCDIVRERAEKAAKEYGTPDARVYTDYKELLKEDDIDVVHVLTPTSSIPSSRWTRWKRANTSCAKSPWPSIPPRPRRCWTRPSAPARS